MILSGLHHAELTVSDLDRSIEFYRDLLGMELAYRTSTERHPDPQAVGMVGEEKALSMIAFMKAGDDVLELIQYLQPIGRKSELRACDPGGGHIAFTVPDMEAAYSVLSARGIKFNTEPRFISDMDYYMGGSYWVYFSDPDGASIELVQPPQQK